MVVLQDAKPAEQTAWEALEAQIARLSKAQKVQLIEILLHQVSDVYPGIEKDADVLGGDARIAGTRIPVWSIVEARRIGMSDAEILATYPSLEPHDLITAWRYARDHVEEIEREIYENDLVMEEDEILHDTI